MRHEINELGILQASEHGTPLNPVGLRKPVPTKTCAGAADARATTRHLFAPVND